MENKIKILFICLGNICRSPAAEGAFRKLVKERNLEYKFEIDSCGTSGYHDGELPDPRTRKVALKRGIELTHRSRKLRQSDLDNYDYLLVMDDQNFREVISLIREDSVKNKVFKFAKFRSDSGSDIVPDPYYGTEKDFESVQNLVEDCSIGLLKFLGE